MTDDSQDLDVAYRRRLRDFNAQLAQPFGDDVMWAMLERAREFDLILVERVLAHLTEHEIRPSGVEDLTAHLRRARIAADQRGHTMTDVERQRRDAECRPIIDEIKARIGTSPSTPTEARMTAINPWRYRQYGPNSRQPDQ
jgi:hypothetical protein